MNNHLVVIEKLADDQRSFVTVGLVRFYVDADSDSGSGETWFRSTQVRALFCRDDQGWYCANGGTGGRGPTPEDAFRDSLRQLADDARLLLGDRS